MKVFSNANSNIANVNRGFSQSLIKFLNSTAFICSKSTKKTLEQFVKSVNDIVSVFIVNFEQIPHIILVFLMLTLTEQMTAV